MRYSPPRSVAHGDAIMTYTFDLEPARQVHRVSTVAMPVIVRTTNHHYCQTDSWDSRSDVSGRCAGISTILDSSDLRCSRFNAPLMASDIKGNDTPAKWGQKHPVKRCSGCIFGEEVWKKR